MHKHTGLVPCQETKSPPEGLRKKNGVCGGEVDGENFEKRDVLVTKPLSLITGSWVIGLSLGKQGEIVGRATGRNSGERYREGG